MTTRWMKTSLLILATAYAASAFAQTPTPAPAKESDEPKATFAVLDFTADDGYSNEGWYSQRVSIGNSVSNMMVTHLVNDGMRMIERQRLADVLKEQDLGAGQRVDPATAAKIGKLIGADYIILGAISEWGLNHKDIGGAGNLLGGPFRSVGLGETSARAKLDIRIVNSTTGEILTVATGSGIEKTTNFSYSPNWYTTMSFDNDEWWSSLLGKATRRAVDKTCEDMVPKAKKLPSLGLAKPSFKSTVLAVLDDGSAVVKLPSDAKVKVGQKFKLRHVKNVVKDGDSVVFEDALDVGTVEVLEVQEKSIKVKLIGEGKIQQGDIVQG